MKHLLILLSMTFIITSCSDKEKENLLDSSWLVDKLVINNQDIPKTNDVLLKILSETTFSLTLDANTCGGSMEVNGDKIKINKAIRCTRMCCDSQFSLAVVEALNMIDSYELSEGSFTLKGGNNTRIYFTKSTKNTLVNNTTKVQAEGDFILFEKEPCFGNCPTYTMKIYKNGYITYKGNKLTKRPQPNSFTVSPERVKPLFDTIESLDFQNYKDLYTDTRIADLSGTIINYKGKKIAVMYGAPEELNNLLNDIRNFAKSTGYTENETKPR